MHRKKTEPKKRKSRAPKGRPDVDANGWPVGFAQSLRAPLDFEWDWVRPPDPPPRDIFEERPCLKRLSR